MGNFKTKTKRSTVFYFHIREKIRKKYKINESLFKLSGNTVLINFDLSQSLVKKINSERIKENKEQIKLSNFLMMGLIDEILHFLSNKFKELTKLNTFETAYYEIEKKINKENTEKLLEKFLTEFPSPALYNKNKSVQNFIQEKQNDLSNKSIITEEILHLWLSNNNQAFLEFSEFFNDEEILKNKEYLKSIEILREYFKAEPPLIYENEDLVYALTLPSILYPHSLKAQLEYLLNKYKDLLKDFIGLYKKINKIEIEEIKYFENISNSFLGYQFDSNEHKLDLNPNESENFSEDREWMGNVILIAKNTLVWLNQLSEKYNKKITTLEQIPEAELEILQQYGINSLWLIGIWERSNASKEIKRSMGNFEAEASAYSIYSYDIAYKLGGWNSLAKLKEKCIKFGIRLSADMVPNHTSIDSEWIYEHPEWFLSLTKPPYDSYSYNSQNLSSRESHEIQIEDHYYEKTDAAVVFKYRNFNDVKYIYHGNDGTSFPWNDTAQIDFTNKNAREAVIQTILHVARNFQIIRFDAAMTLVKKHIKRLWHPNENDMGSIPSRTWTGLSEKKFEEMVPKEFWIEVVERIKQEIPDTLLLAEAFWFMEGYFVRNLGLNRVYNSAFMHMLRDEDNKKYRDSIKEVLKFDPRILKRYVNFMSNPDEKTTIAQFGDSNKYFGVLTLMVTLPGLPMFAHGQIEGFKEKYGMEYSKAYVFENENTDLIKRHLKEISPILKKRYLFSDIKHFRLFDFYENNKINENIYAFTNRKGSDTTLVFFNNSNQKTIGAIKYSVDYLNEYSELGNSLNLKNNKDKFSLALDLVKNKWRIFKNTDIFSFGIMVNLDEYGKIVFANIHEVENSSSEPWEMIYNNYQNKYIDNLDLVFEKYKNKSIETIYNEISNIEEDSYIVKNFEISLGLIISKINDLISKINKANKTKLKEYELIKIIKDKIEIAKKHFKKIINESSKENDDISLFIKSKTFSQIAKQYILCNSIEQFLTSKKIEKVEKILEIVDSNTKYNIELDELNELIEKAKDETWKNFLKDELTEKVINKNEKAIKDNDEKVIESIFILSKIINTDMNKANIKKILEKMSNK